jgi:hypothetical protein
MHRAGKLKLNDRLDTSRRTKLDPRSFGEGGDWRQSDITDERLPEPQDEKVALLLLRRQPISLQIAHSIKRGAMPS